ncbi:hypothetical protein BGZ97_010486, partial [Linnemannia gamsii]
MTKQHLDQAHPYGSATASSPAFGEDDELHKSLDISNSKAVGNTSRPQGTLGVFPENIPKPAIKTALHYPQQRIERIDQLIYCSTILLQDAPSLSPPDHNQPLNEAEATWLAE